jgi:hypothetical protein
MELPLELAVKLADYETELDALHPKWRERQPFGELPLEALKRVKYLLKRISHLRAGKDWEVRLVEGNNGRWFAHSILPENCLIPPAPPVEQPLINAEALRVALQSPELAAQLKAMGVLP